MTINFGRHDSGFERHDFGSKVTDSDVEGSDRANFSGEKKKKGTMRLSGGYRCSRK